MSILRRLAPERRGADPTLAWGSSAIPTNSMAYAPVAAGVAINDDSALSISTVYRCIQIRAEAVSTLSITGLRRTKDRTKTFVGHPLIDNPSPDMTRVDFYAQMMFSVLLRGNFFAQIVDRDPDGFPTALVPIHPDSVMARRVDGKRTYWVNGRPMKTDDMFHMPSSMVPPGGFLGLNPVEYMRSSWGLAAAAEKYGGQFFANSAHASGIITIPGDLNEEETLELRRAWMGAHGGIGSALLPAVLTGGATWTQMSINPDDAQFLATRTFQRHEIASWFGVPPGMLGDQDRSTAIAGIEQGEMSFVTNILRPDLVRIESYISRILPGPISIKFDLADRLRADTLQRYQAYQIARNMGVLNADEIRAKEDLPVIPNGLGQIYLSPMNMAPLGTAPDDPSLKPTNDGGFGGGGGNPANSPKQTGPDKP